MPQRALQPVVQISDDGGAAPKRRPLLMRSADISCCAFASAERVFQEAYPAHEDCVFLEKAMPRMTAPQLPNLPVIAISARDHAERPAVNGCDSLRHDPSVREAIGRRGH